MCPSGTKNGKDISISGHIVGNTSWSLWLEQLLKFVIITEWNPTLRSLCLKAFKRIGNTLTGTGMAGVANDIVLQVIWNIKSNTNEFPNLYLEQQQPLEYKGSFCN